MKKWLFLSVCILLTFLCVSAVASVSIDAAHFPDELFRAELSWYDQDQDNVLSDAELSSVQLLHVTYKCISSLQGIEYFTSLKELRVSGNELTSLDLSKNTLLEVLECSSNRLSSLDLSKNTKLTRLYCGSNKLTALNLGNNTKLAQLYCNSNMLTALDLSKNTALDSIDCSSNKLTSLVLGKKPLLWNLTCSGNKLSSLDLGSMPKLDVLDCGSNKLTSLNLGSLPSLISLDCHSNSLSSLDCSKNKKLEYLYCGKNKLSKLNVSACTRMWTLECNNNKLSSLKLSGMKDLHALVCNNNSLAALNTSANTKLEGLYCDHNKLSSLDVGTNRKLRNLTCHANKLTSLDVSSCSELVKYVKKNRRATTKGYDYFGLDESGGITLSVDRTVAVIAGSRTSKPTVQPTSATVDGLKYNLNNNKKTATFTGATNKNLHELTIPDEITVYDVKYKITQIAANACSGMAKLKKLVIGKYVKTIGDKAFYQCKKLVRITIKTTRLQEKAIGKNAFKTGSKDGSVKVPSSTLALYQGLLPKKGLPKSWKITK